MFPLQLAELNEEKTICRVAGKPQEKAHLQDLGFVPGTSVRIQVKNNGNFICKIRDTRVALTDQLARRIYVS